MHGAALDAHVARLHLYAFARVHEQFCRALDHDAIVHALGAVHGALGVRSAVHDAQHGAVRQRQRSGHDLGFEALVVRNVHGHSVRLPEDIVFGGATGDALPVALVDALDGRLAGGFVVARDDSLRVGVSEAIGDWP